MKVFEIILTFILALVTTLLPLKRNKEDFNSYKMPKRFFMRFTIYGCFAGILILALMVISISDYFSSQSQRNLLKNEDITAEVIIRAYSKEKIDSIMIMLPNELYVRHTKIGNDQIKIDFKKESPYSGAKGNGNWWLTLRSTSVFLDPDYRFNSNTIQDLNNQDFNGQIPEINDIACRFKESVSIEFHLRIRNKLFGGFIDCGDYIQINIKDLK